MAKLCFTIRSQENENENGFSSFQELSSHRDSKRNLLGAVRLSKGGTVRVDNGKVFYAEDAHFLPPDRCYKIEDIGPRLILSIDADPVFARLCSKYSNIVRLRAPEIVGDSVHFTVKLCVEDREGLRDVFSLVREALSSGVEGSDPVSGACRINDISTMRLVAVCGKFIDRYLSWYIRRAAISGNILVEDGSLSLDNKFFMDSVDGLVLLHDECEYGVLSLLQAHTEAFPCMSKRMHREFVYAAHKAIEDIKECAESFTAEDQLYLEKRSFANACVASVFSLGALVRYRLIRHIEEFSESSGRHHSKDIIREALEVLAIDMALSGDDKLSKEDWERILKIDGDFLETCKKYEGIASKLRFPSGLRIKVESEQEIENMGVLGDFLSKYDRAYDSTVGRGLYGREILGNAFSGKPWNSVQRRKGMEMLTDFCLAEAYFKLLYTAPIPKQADIISFGDRVVIDSRVNGIYVGLHGDVVPADSVSFEKMDEDALRRMRLRMFADRERAKLTSCAIVAASILFAAFVSAILFVSLPGVSTSAVMPWCLVTIVLISVAAVGCAVVPYALQNRKTAAEIENPDLYLCISYKNDLVFNSVKACSNPSDFRFSSNSLYVNGSVVPHDKYKMSLVDANTALTGRCTLFRIQGAEDHKAGLALLSALANTAGSMQIAELHVTGALPSLKTGYILRCSFQLSSRESYLRVAEVFAKAGRPAMLLAYLDSYVSVAVSEGENGLSKDFVRSDAYRFLCRDQANWGTFDNILGYCSKYLVGDRRVFAEEVISHWKNSERRVTERLFAGAASVFSGELGFPFDHKNFLSAVECAHKGFDRLSNSLSEEVLLDFDEVSHAFHGKRISRERAVESDISKPLQSVSINSGCGIVDSAVRGYS